MNNRILKSVSRRRKRLGRGYGSGKGGHTVGKGQKGQKTRKKLGVLFEGVKVKKSLIKRLPFLRGKNKFKGGLKPIVIDLKLLNDFPGGTKVDIDYLVDRKLVKKDDAVSKGVKILGSTDITKRLIIALPISKTASGKITKAGGKILEV
jgi:large subunit ribosomal protein L15